MRPINLASLLIVFLLSSNIFAQDRYKPSAYEISTLPQWAQEMYGENPNILQVRSLYKNYYQNNPFEKSFHTQYYKKWNKQLCDRIDADGFEIKIDLREKIDRVSQTLTANSRAGAWSVLGPFVARNTNGDTVAQQSNIYSVDQAASNPSVWYCGTETGEIYGSTNAGESWVNLSLNQVLDGGVRAIEIDPQNANVVYAASGDFIFKTIDGGQNWTISMALNGLNAHEILALPNGPDTVLVAANLGLYRSTDGGQNWTAIYTQRCHDIKANTANASTLYLVKNNPTLDLCEFFISNDAGATFTQQTSGWHTSTDPGKNDGGARLAVSDANPNRVYAYLIGESKAGDTGYIGVYRSDDGGINWTLPNGPAGGPYTAGHANLAIGSPSWQYHQGFYNCAIVASHTNPDHILVGGLNLYKSEDGGATFTALAGYVGGNYAIHVDMQDFRSMGNSTIISTDGGIYHSNDFFETANFEVKMTGIHASDYWGFGQGWNTDVFVGGLYHNGNLAFHENYGAGNFLQLGGGEPASGYVNPGENRKVYSSDINGKILPLNIGDPVASVGFGINPNESYWSAESSELEFLPHCYNIAFTGFENDLWRTEDGGNTFMQWAEFGNDDTHEITYFEIARSNPDVMYVCQRLASQGRLWKTTDGGQNWSVLTLPVIGGSNRKMLVQVDPTNENNVWIAFPSGSNGTKVYKSTNGGTSWTNLTTSDLNGENIHSIAFIPNTGGGIYAFTHKGAWYRTDASSSWSDFSTGLPLEINSNIAKPFYRDGKIRLASYGRGVWESYLEDEPTNPVAQISVDKLEITQHCSIDTFYFVDQSIVNHTGASWTWDFPGGSPSAATGVYAAVAYNTPGNYVVRLTVTDGSGNSSVDSIYINIAPYQAQNFVGEAFEMAFPPVQFEIENPDNSYTWEQTSDAGGFGLSTMAAWFNNFDYWPGGGEDDLRVSVDFNNPVDNWLSFDVAYAQYAVNYADSLEVLISTDCGQTMQSVYFKGGVDLATAPDINTPFVPQASEWRKDSVDLTSYVGTNEIMIIFRNHSAWGNNVFLDNINLAQQVVALDKTADELELLVYPNPIRSASLLNCTTQSPANFVLYNLEGKKVFEQQNIENTIPLPDLVSGVYVYQLSNEKVWKRGKLVIK